MLHLPIPIQPQKQIDCVPYLLTSLNIVCVETGCTAVPAFIEVRRQHNNRLFSGRRHGVVCIPPLLNMLIALRIRNGGGDVRLHKAIICVMLQDQVCFYLWKKIICCHAIRHLSVILRLPPSALPILAWQAGR